MNRLLFDEISQEKRLKIINAALKEFSIYGYELCSTNQIVKKAGISKGSLFKYFETKEDLFFFLIDYVVQRMTKQPLNLSDNLFERIRQYAEYEFDFYLENPIEYNFLKKAFYDENSSMSTKTIEKYTKQAEESFYDLCQSKEFDLNKQRELADILKWVLKGFNEEFIHSQKSTQPENLKNLYLEQLDQYLTLLKRIVEVK